MPKCKIYLYEPIEMSDGTILPLELEGFVMSDDKSNLCMIIYQGKKVLVKREKINKMERIMERKE